MVIVTKTFLKCGLQQGLCRVVFSPFEFAYDCTPALRVSYRNPYYVFTIERGHLDLFNRNSL
jgi:hypothetical protein